MSNNQQSSKGLDRRSFMKGAGMTAIAGAAGTVASVAGTTASAQESSSLDIPKLANGKYDFETIYNRVGSNCARWDSPPRNYPGGEFKFGMGVASMDFECAPCITEALQERINHHSWGYLSSTEGLRDGILRWNGERHGVDLAPEMVTISDGVYPGMIAAMRAFVPRGSKLLLSTPAYTGFYSMASAANVEIIDSEMKYVNGRYEIDYDDLEAKMTPDVRAMIVCNPQNPTGNVWTEEELLRVGRLCLEHNIIVLSDEIHSDVIRRGHKYTPFASLPDEAVVNNSVSFNAISKTFNLAAMKNAYYYSKSPVTKGRVDKYHRAELSTLGVVANEAAYNHGAEWFEEANAYMDDTHSYIESYVKQYMPTVGYTKNEGTYMTFLDFSKTMESVGAKEMFASHGKASPEHYFQDWLVHNSGVYLNPGFGYGAGGAGHMRMNIASSRVVIKEVLDAMAAAVNKV
ncbi:MAG: aminotransferase class I/II-fold pyridoxal phosphate-dependent enzyme [Gammaproteobacteria bacterium]|nr:aminotransferase class I/II-fold pyridoxal phosphate-dependent enzyme [Gammaproteobacteria bacterium]MDD9895843.1 aminotransferase class I/II-fold pyridoxal phosphate-dependent enzyme [Gammaproteobacteria bacterium]MDD9958940.1 aminotransferase class I/II-fold pyridoxal phosphate-dependent enzyme [Gammaproteobacteria bacterium]